MKLIYLTQKQNFKDEKLDFKLMILDTVKTYLQLIIISNSS